MPARGAARSRARAATARETDPQGASSQLSEPRPARGALVWISHARPRELFYPVDAAHSAREFRIPDFTNDPIRPVADERQYVGGGGETLALILNEGGSTR